ncbi:hypothetical protein P3F83_01815 [Mycobacteroides immunogenum]|uniref:hypothetical protein n=1 Tax=Mycobacteroides immunogenum TaxID=83262 RepID=UPI0025B78EC5|nr:hypothetical protein [Mycobacteroides immunogenum]WJR34210.1 hypothetical protein P3F83_01815 [Mycobacteroides immunogenum]
MAANQENQEEGIAKPQDFAGLKAELAELTNDILPLAHDLRLRLEDNKYRWEIHHFGLDEGYDKSVVSEIVTCLGDTLRGLAAADLNLMDASLKADGHSPGKPSN